ncbi:MAG: dockerin type I domain-containing protein [Pseudomonadota bacterium]
MTINTFLKRLLSAAALALGLSAAAGDVALSGTDGTGFISLSELNNEVVEPNTDQPGSKQFDYPYYFDANSGLYVMLVAEPLSEASVYAEEAIFTVENKTITDADFGFFDFGLMSYDDALVSATGQSIVGPSDLTFELDGTDVSPIFGPRNPNNEFGWSYRLSVANVTGSGLTFEGGQLVSIDLLGDIVVSVFFADQFEITPPFTESGSFRIAGNQLVFDLDQTQDLTTPLGLISDSRMVFNRSGTIEGIALPDSDGDGADDGSDNCTLTANASQLDADSDGYGNACDADFNNDCATNFVDFAALSNAFLSTNALYDLNGDGSVNFLDISFFSTLFLTEPGPSALTAVCN